MVGMIAGEGKYGGRWGGRGRGGRGGRGGRRSMICEHAADHSVAGMTPR